MEGKRKVFFNVVDRCCCCCCSCCNSIDDDAVRGWKPRFTDSEYESDRIVLDINMAIIHKGNLRAINVLEKERTRRTLVLLGVVR